MKIIRGKNKTIFKKLQKKTHITKSKKWTRKNMHKIISTPKNTPKNKLLKKADLKIKKWKNQYTSVIINFSIDFIKYSFDFSAKKVVEVVQSQRWLVQDPAPFL